MKDDCSKFHSVCMFYWLLQPAGILNCNCTLLCCQTVYCRAEHFHLLDFEECHSLYLHFYNEQLIYIPVVYIPLHIGSVPFQFPSSKHVLILSPLHEFMCIQLLIPSFVSTAMVNVPNCNPCIATSNKWIPPVFFENTTIGSMANYSCEQGFELIGVSSRTCQGDSTWSDLPPMCAGMCWHLQKNNHTYHIDEV